MSISVLKIFKTRTMILNSTLTNHIITSAELSQQSQNVFLPKNLNAKKNSSNLKLRLKNYKIDEQSSVFSSNSNSEFNKSVNKKDINEFKIACYTLFVLIVIFLIYSCYFLKTISLYLTN